MTVEKVDITNRYPEEVELRFDDRPYVAYYQMLSKVFVLDKLKSFCDVGCSTGHLMAQIKNQHSNIEIKGYEFFEYQKNNAPETVRGCIDIVDLRDSLGDSVSRYDLVNCTEVGEHIDAAYAVSLLDNLKKLTGRFLVMSWSDSGGLAEPQNDPYHQHLNPLKKEQFYKLMEENGFILQVQATDALLANSYQPNFHDWWRKSLSVWKVKND